MSAKSTEPRVSTSITPQRDEERYCFGIVFCPLLHTCSYVLCICNLLIDIMSSKCVTLISPTYELVDEIEH